MKKLQHVMTRYSSLFAAILIVILLSLQLWNAWEDSQTIDEAVHLTAGYSYIDRGDFHLNVEHPPLVKELAALPLFFFPVEFPYDHPGWIEDNQWTVAPVFLYENVVSPRTMLFFSRLPTVVFSLLLAWAVFKWTKQLFGPTAALFSLALVVFDPNIRAHGHYITTDIPLTALVVCTLWAFERTLRNPTWKKYFGVAVLLSLALLTKFSAIFLVPSLLLLWIIRAVQTRKSSLRLPLSFSNALRFAALCAVTFFVVAWSVYGFERIIPNQDTSTAELIQKGLSSLEDGSINEKPQPVQNLAHWTLDLDYPSARLIRPILENTPIPFYSYFHGLGRLIQHNYWGHSTYLKGEVANSFPDYFWVAFFVKTPEVTLIFLGILLAVVVRRIVDWIHGFENHPFLRTQPIFLRFSTALVTLPFFVYVLFLPAILYFFWSLTSHINLGIRHLLPIYPLLYIAMGRLATIRVSAAQPAFTAILAMLLTIFITSSLWIYPHDISYFNSFIGGPNRGHVYLLDSNLDWGQDLNRLKKYLDDNQVTEPIDFAYFGSARPEEYGIDWQPLPKDSAVDVSAYRGFAVINILSLVSPDSKYTWLRKFSPVDRIGYSFYLYDFRR